MRVTAGTDGLWPLTSQLIQRGQPHCPPIAPPAQCCLDSTFFQEKPQFSLNVPISMSATNSYFEKAQMWLLPFTAESTNMAWETPVGRAQSQPRDTALRMDGAVTDRRHHTEDTEQSQEHGKLRPRVAMGTSTAGRHIHAGAWGWQRRCPHRATPRPLSSSRERPKCARVWLWGRAGKASMPKLRLLEKDWCTEANLPSGKGS